MALSRKDRSLEKAGPFIGPRGGKWADAAHTIPYDAKGKTGRVAGRALGKYTKQLLADIVSVARGKVARGDMSIISWGAETKKEVAALRTLVKRGLIRLVETNQRAAQWNAPDLVWVDYDVELLARHLLEPAPKRNMQKGLNEPALISHKFVMAQDRLARHPVGVVDRERKRYELEVMRAMETPPRPFTASMMLDDPKVPLRASGVVRDLGMELGKESDWATYLENAFHTAANEVALRRMVFDKCKDDNLHPAQRRLIMQRSMSYYRDMSKSVVEVCTPDQLIKAEPKGGKYYRRVPKKKGKGFTYYYDQDKYDRSQTAHVDGPGALEKRIAGEAGKVVESAGEKGCDVKAFGDMVKKYGAKAVGGALKSGVSKKSLAYRGNKFHSMTAPAGQQRPDPPKKPKDEKPEPKDGAEKDKPEVEKGFRFVIGDQ